MAVSMSWRSFQLFEYLPIKDPTYGSESPLYSDGSLSAICGHHSYMVIAVNNSYVKIISKELKEVKGFLAYESDYRISYLRSIDGTDIVVTLAEKQGSPSVVKLWNVSKIIASDGDDSEAMIHRFQSQVVVQNGDNSYPVSSFELNDDASCLILGFANGKVVLVRGDIIRDRGSKQRTIYETTEPITGLHLNKLQGVIYVTTTSKILLLPTTGRNSGKPLRVLSSKSGVDLNCSDIDGPSQKLIVGTTSAIRYYNHLSRSDSINFEIPKKRISRLSKNFLLIVSVTDEYIDSTKTKKMMCRIMVIDLLNKHIAFALTIPNVIVTHVFKCWGNINLLTSDGALYQLIEKPINQQVELILQRELFPVAYNLAIQSNLPVSMVLKIQKLQGNYLYEKSEFEESIDTSIKCLELYKQARPGDLEDDIDDFIMSTITKFKDVSNIDYLTKFLLRLYELELANNDHVTLLLCCYCKLNMAEKLSDFIDALNLEDNVDLNELNFQLIINLFKECGYFEQVIKLFHKLNQPGLIAEIQLYDIDQPEQCLRFIKTLSVDELLRILIDHSKKLLDVLPMETTELLINVFTGKYSPDEPDDDMLYSGDKGKTLEDGLSERNKTVNSYQAFLTYLSGSAGQEDETMDSQVTQAPTYLPPKPSLVYSCFVDNPNEFIIFLEACIETFERYQGKLTDKKDLLIALLEMYLSLLQKDGDQQWYQKAKSLVNEYGSLLDKDSLLLISHIYDFKEGRIAAENETGFELNLFRASQVVDDVEGCFSVVEKYGRGQPELYKMMLKFMVSKREVFSKITKDRFRSILSKVDQYNLASPLEVIQILGATEYTNVGLVKDYLIEFIENQNTETSNNLKLIEYYESESTKNSHKLTELTSKPFIMNNNRCSTCNLRLDFPMIHFKCKHSFHQKCINENYIVSKSIDRNAQHCPICINEFDEIKSIRSEQLESKEKTDAFVSSLEESSDKFRFIAEYIGKGVMEDKSVTLLGE